jgi:lysophospholipase L1-like esterase
MSSRARRPGVALQGRFTELGGSLLVVTALAAIASVLVASAATTCIDGGIRYAVASVGQKNDTADGWTVDRPSGGSVSTSLIDRGGDGHWQQLVITNPDMATCELWQQRADVGVGWSPGDTVWAAVEFEYDADATVNGSLWARVSFSDGYGSTADNHRTSFDLPITYLPAAGSGVMLTPTVAVPIGTTRLQFLVGGNIAGTWRFGRATMRVNTPLSRATTVALLGDSITRANWDYSAGPSGSKDCHGYFTWANILAGQRLDPTVYAGVGGDTTADMLARLNADVIAQEPDWCIVQGGTNDCSKGLAEATIEANLQTMYEALDAAGVSVIATTITGTELTTRRNVNDWIRTYATAHGIPLADWSSVIEHEDGSPLTGMTNDGIHPSPSGAAKLGEVLAAVISAQVAADSVLPASAAASGELLDNGFFSSDRTAPTTSASDAMSGRR